MKKYLPLYIGCCWLLLNSQGNALAQNKNEFMKSVVINKITSKQDTSIQYALFIPSTYNATQSMPVLFLFDPMAQGVFPVEKYKILAEKYGYILAGSNNSKNGMEWDRNLEQIEIFMNDVIMRLNIDSTRMYTGGFSGGSRVASYVAMLYPTIKGVIGMGAGFPSIEKDFQPHFDYIGFAGMADFNWSEMQNMDTYLDTLSLRHQFIYFEGGHEWAPTSVAEDAFVWMQLNAMKDGVIAKNTSFIKNYLQKCKDSLLVLDKTEQVHNQFLLEKKMKNFFNRLDSSVNSYPTTPSPVLKKCLARKDSILQAEYLLQKKYSGSFYTKDIIWWQKEATALKETSMHKNDPDIANLYKRLLSFLSLEAYLNANQAITYKKLDVAEEYLKIYQTIDPDNPEHQFLLATIYSERKDTKAVKKYLINAFTLGFNDYERITKHSQLSRYPWQKILEEVRATKKE